MTRWYVGEDKTYNFTLDNNGVNTIPTTIAFKYKEGRLGQWVSVTPTLVSSYPTDPSKVPFYTATVTPQYGGPVYWRWETTGPNFAQEGMDYCQKSQFGYFMEPYQAYDYGWGRW